MTGIRWSRLAVIAVGFPGLMFLLATLFPGVPWSDPFPASLTFFVGVVGTCSAADWWWG